MQNQDFSSIESPAEAVAAKVSVKPLETPLQKLPRLPWATIVLVSFIFGLIGGYVAKFDRVTPWAKMFIGQSARTESSDAIDARAVPSEDQSVVDVVDQASPAVVSIVISKDVPKVRRSPFGFPFFFNQPLPESNPEDGGSTRQTVGHGSGFFVSADGYIVTNKHVVSDRGSEYMVITNDGQELSATVLALDPVNDVAVIKVDGDGFPALTLGDSDRIRVGETAIAIGNPLGEFANSVSRGIISGLKRRVVAGVSYGQEEVLRDIIQTDAAINPGNSGGPLLNLESAVIGVNVAVAQGAENIGFAIPVNQIKRAVDEVRRTGRIAVPYIGVRYILLNEEISQQAGLSTDYGALVQRGERLTDFAIIPGSPADKAGLVENDIILEIDGERVDSEHPLANIIAGKQVGDAVKLRIQHKGEEKDVMVKLEERMEQ